jgi:hypothetical protein
VIEGEECNGRVSLFGELSDEVFARNPGAKKPVVAVMDGERALWKVLNFFLPCAIGILDMFHVLDFIQACAFDRTQQNSREMQKPPVFIA